MRVLGLDHGTKRIGMALSDPMGWTARGLGVIPVEGEGEASGVLESIARIVAEERVEEIVVGLPRNMDGTLGPRAEEVLRFVGALRQSIEIPVATVDERLTSKEADAILRRNRPRRDGRSRQAREERDMVAAQILLTDYLESRRNPDRGTSG